VTFILDKVLFLSVSKIFPEPGEVAVVLIFETVGLFQAKETEEVPLNGV
jgi:hypothetical protein